MRKRYFAGIGSRSTPPDICTDMTKVARHMARMGFVLRSGGAEGADEAFERGARLKEIFLPWKKFRDNPSPLHSFSPDILRGAMEIAQRYHPAWNRCNSGARKLHARNTFQVLGLDLNTPVEYVICWTKDGKASGGTGQALRIATALRIEIINLYHEDAIDSVWKIT